MNLKHIPDITLAHDGMILFLWKSGLDTYEIGKRVGLHESHIANRLWKLRSAA